MVEHMKQKRRRWPCSMLPDSRGKRLARWLSMPLLFVCYAVVHQAAAAVPDKPWLAQTLSAEDIRHLVGRTGFGVSAQEQMAFKGRSRASAIDHIINGLTQQPAVAMPAWTRAPVPRFHARGAMSRAEKQAFDLARDREMSELRQWWVNTMLTTESPQTERLVLFWHDHFATSYAGLNRRSISMARQNQLFRELGAGSYRDLLKAVIRDPAMLIYLNGQQNRKGKPNENLARELLELFTLGEGNYSEATVKEAARALTGHGFSETHNMAFHLIAHRRDLNNKTLFGVNANHDGDSLVDLILQQPSAATHLVTKFWHGFVSDSTADADFVKKLSDDFRATDYNLLSLYRNVLESEQFWHSNNRLALIKSPATLLIGTARTLDYPKQHWLQMPSWHALLGMDLFAPPSVAGWHEGEAFVAPGLLLNRQRAVKQLVNNRTRAPRSESGEMMSMSNSMSNSMVNDGTMASNDAPLAVKVSAHLYQGPPDFRVSLFNNGKTVWVSDDHTLHSGYDTEVFGPMRERSMLPWTTVEFNPPAQALNDATNVEIEFINDAAGEAGDRNLFVDEVIINKRRLNSALGVQTSACPPKNKRQAGNLYCAGTLNIALDKHTDQAVPRPAGFTLTEARAMWTAERNQKVSATIALENVQLYNDFFHTLSFNVIADKRGNVELRLNSLGCWPDCIRQWPECAWQEDAAPSMLTLSFRAGNNGANAPACHYQSLSDSEHVMLSALWGNLERFLDRAASGGEKKKHRRNLLLLRERVAGAESNILNSGYLIDSAIAAINPKFVSPTTPATLIPEPNIVLRSVSDVAQLAESQKLSLQDWLIGGVSAAQFPALQNNRPLSPQQQLQSVLTHPVFQVY